MSMCSQVFALQGWVAEVEGHDCVVCPYHGWAFDGEGVLQDVPAAEHQKEWPRKQLVQSYPVKEKVRSLALLHSARAPQRWRHVNLARMIDCGTTWFVVRNGGSVSRSNR